MKLQTSRVALLVVLTAAMLAVAGCTGGYERGSEMPTAGTMPTAEPLPTAGAIPTAGPLPTAEALPTSEALPTVPVSVSPVPRSTSDPIIGTWEWQGENNTLVIFSFEADGTFQRRDEGTAMNLSTGSWANEGSGSYKLIYDTPGYVPEHLTYDKDVSRLGSGSNYFSRI